MRPGDGGFRIPSDATLENRISTLRESGVLEDLFENRRRWITGSAGKSATLRGKFFTNRSTMSNETLATEFQMTFVDDTSFWIFLRTKLPNLFNLNLIGNTFRIYDFSFAFAKREGVSSNLNVSNDTDYL